ncbi:MAG: CoA pyrophosphatase [bacterium]|nr:CoA pyrophosphatase [bacterium]
MTFSERISALQDITINGLPGEQSHSELMPVNRPYSSQVRLNAQDFRQSAVAIVLYEEQNELMSLLIQRPFYKGVHSSQISFPGGKRDPEDPNIEFTARRECMEEVAIPMEELSLVGKLTDVYIPVSKFIVSPHLFSVDALPELIPDDREVDEIIPFKVSRLLEADSIQYTDIQFTNGFKQKNVPYFAIDDKIVWGATGMILSEFRTILKQL